MTGASQPTTWKEHLHEVIFEADTPAGKGFDVALLVAIGVSVTVVILESVPSIRAVHGKTLRLAEWVFTLLFTVEYALRLISVRQPMRYATSFFGLVDLAAILPTYLSLFIGGAHALLVIRALRLLRIFRVFRAGQFSRELTLLVDAVKASRAKITVFMLTVLTIVLILGATIYAIEGPEHGFSSIPTGIFSMELVRAGTKPMTTQNCPDCSREGHDLDAAFCKYCGGGL